jgi:hypothetical protein
MSKLLFFAALALALHAVIHLLGVAAYWRLAEIEVLPYKTALFDGRMRVGDRGMRLFGGAFLVTGLVFLTAAGALAAGAPWARPLILGTAAMSLVITTLDWDVAYAGIAFNIAIVAALLLSR